MDGQKRKPHSKKSFIFDPLEDVGISTFAEKLKTLKNQDFQLKTKFDEIESVLSGEDKRRLQLVKLLYCLDYKKEAFLYLAVILESQVNSLIFLYRSKAWITPKKFESRQKQDAFFEHFVTKQTLSEKAGSIIAFGLFNDDETDRIIRNLLDNLSILRNYGAHDKPLSLFLEEMALRNADNEICNIFDTIKKVIAGKKILIDTKPPTTLP